MASATLFLCPVEDIICVHAVPYSHHPSKVCPFAFSSVVCMTDGLCQRQRTSVSQHVQRPCFCPCASLIFYPTTPPSGILGHNGFADVLRMLSGCEKTKVRHSLVSFSCVHADSFSLHPTKVSAVFMPIMVLIYQFASLRTDKNRCMKGTHIPVRIMF